MSKLDDLLFTLDICKKSLPVDAHAFHYERLNEIENILKMEFLEPKDSSKLKRKNILDHLMTSDNFSQPLNDSEVLNHLLFLIAMLKLDDLPKMNNLPKYLLGLVKSAQKHCVETCIDQISGNQIFPAYIQLYEFIQGNDAPFTNEEINILKYLVDLLKDKLLKKKRG
ncbi:hypothetical protein [Paenibacillus agricola]|uniref:Uncharacterized protein n=1 Tax=Paenibacillus agricola TaxID=2716264 RepID=A0ABX0JA63_9BACL|nr:hypothetical protein [Paenibacillus agricola]NHN33335.1 hypothetical protein [Paenibacillus agricola]